MTDEEKIKAVTATLAGEFYVGQEVMMWSEDSNIYRCRVVRLTHSSLPHRLSVEVLEIIEENLIYDTSLVGRPLYPTKYQLRPL